jgi:hypothetical protein
MKRKHASGADSHRDGDRTSNLERLPTAVAVCILQCLGPRNLARTLRTSAWFPASPSRSP